MLRDPLSWRLPLGRIFGINVQMHVLFPLIALGLVLRVAFQRPAEGYQVIDGTWRDMAVLVTLLILATLVHELGHCLVARRVHGDAHEILLWPLGGLASVEVPPSPRAHFVTAAAGPLANLALCLICGLILILGFALWPPLNPLTNGFPWRENAEGVVRLFGWGSRGLQSIPNEGMGMIPVLLARFFWVNWFLALLNLVLLGYPLDGGRMLQAALWPYLGYRQAMLTAIFAGFLTMFVVGLFAIVMNELLALCLAAFIYVACRQEWVLLETGGEEGSFGYDFSQGYTTLERDRDPTTASPPRRRQNWWQRWQQRRSARRVQREMETREADERRMDLLLTKVQEQGIGALTEEERRFLKRVSDRFRNR